ncbi:MAG: signal peptide peptidase SppA [Candidatus Diapherotrites archaeon]
MKKSVEKKGNEFELKQEKPFPNLVIIAVVAFVLFFIFLGFFLILTFSGNYSTTKNNIAIIPLQGQIFAGKDAYDGILSSEEIVELIEQANNNNSVAAILLDIDSGGGEVVASKQLVYAIRESKKPVYAYINSIGASGAYYAAAAADYIMADEDSITGSIGVISIFPNFTELLEKIGIKVTVLTEGKYKASGSGFTEFTQEEQELFKQILSETYNKFKADVLEFRAGKISAKQFESIADGRIMSGRQAYYAGLVDELLPKNKVLKRIGELENIKDPKPLYLQEEKFSLSKLFFDVGASFGKGVLFSIKTESEKNKMSFE